MWPVRNVVDTGSDSSPDRSNTSNEKRNEMEILKRTGIEWNTQKGTLTSLPSSQKPGTVNYAKLNSSNPWTPTLSKINFNIIIQLRRGVPNDHFSSVFRQFFYVFLNSHIIRKYCLHRATNKNKQKQNLFELKKIARMLDCKPTLSTLASIRSPARCMFWKCDRLTPPNLFT
jgi:hypothetical protein